MPVAGGPIGFSRKEQTMKEMEIAAYARQLFEQYGPKAIAIAGQRLRNSQEKGDEDGVRKWRRIETALTELRGPRET
jgi:hypothetical protein